MKVCIVGGTGNISLSIVHLLLELGHDVTCFNRGRSGDVPEGARLIVGDRHDRDGFEKTMQQEAFDAAIDVICYNRQDALSDIRAFRGISHFIQISTVATFGVDYDWMPVTEDHPLRPITDYGRNKVEADKALLDAYEEEGFPVTIIKPATTYGPKMGLLRQIAWDFSWLDRIKDGRPILICGDGNIIHQFLHVDDAALCFAHILGRQKCIGQVYNMVNKGFVFWKDHHKTAMKVLGRSVEMIGVNCHDLDVFGVPDSAICTDVYSHNHYFSSEKLFKDVPEFKPRMSLEEGIRRVYETMLEQNRITVSESGGWEDTMIERIKKMQGLTH